MVEPSLESRLRAASDRLTPQRKLIAAILQRHGGHLSAEEIHRLARREQPRLSLATVYRTLRWLKESGLARELRLEGDRHRYEMVRKGAHQHIVCLGCGSVIEFVCDHYDDVHGDLAERFGFQITNARVKLFGYCADCQQQLHNTKRRLSR
jgi:Fe2+ or Zn2+ uptake regulation protein